MASIQQSLNQLLGAAAGAATAGSYMYAHHPGTQARQADKAAATIMKDREGLINERTSKLASGAIEKDGITEKALIKTEENLRDLQEGFAHKAYSLSPTADRARSIMRLERGKAARQIFAEQNSAERLNQQTQSTRDMLAGLLERKDLLSAKKRGQLNDIYHTIDKKGGFDN